MYAIVEIAGQQFKVEKKQEIFVHRLEGEEGSKVDFSEVMLIDNNGKVIVGTPLIDGALVSARILEHMKGDKVLVFKKKRRKGYQKLNGHRQYMTRLVIENILENAPKAEKPAAKEEVKEAAPEAKAEPKAEKPVTKKEVKKAAPKAKAKPKAEKPAEEKKAAAPKKPAAAKKAAPKATKEEPGKVTKKAAPKAKKTDEKEDK
jgi:large subunit ribosomal protein L21